MGKDPVGAIIDVYKRTDNISLSRLAVIQALLSYGIITHAQYMSFIYMKNEMMAIKSRSQQGSVKAEVGSEHCNSDGHITDNEEAGETVDRERNKNSEIQVLKDCLLRQGKESLIPWLQSVLLDACRVKMFPGTEFNILGFRLKRSSFCSTNLDFIFQRTLEKFFRGFLIFGLLIIFILLLRKSVQLTRKTLNSAQRNWTRSLSEIARTK